MNQPLLDIKNLHVRLPLPNGILHAVRGVDLSIDAGEALGLVGESGSGKSMTALALARLLPRSAVVTADKLQFDQNDLQSLPDQQFSGQISSQRISIIFQDPMSSLNPVYTIGRQLSEAVLIHSKRSRKEAADRAVELLERVGIPEPRNRLKQYPHELSGGQRQRVMIAMALMNQPELIIADEPTTALDVTVQAEILRLLRDLQQQFGMALLLITHDLGVVSRAVDKVAVMYAGQIVEHGSRARVLNDARHPYTRGLLACVPIAGQADRKLSAIPGIVPSLISKVEGCSFANRCSVMREICQTGSIPMRKLESSHAARCQPEELAKSSLATIDAPLRRTNTTRLASNSPIIAAQSVSRAFSVKSGLFGPKRRLQAVDKVDLDIKPGKTLALVGESGCGKSTLATMLLGQQLPDTGEILLNGEPVYGLDRQTRAATVQAIFQDPYASLNPRHTIAEIIGRPLDVLDLGERSERNKRVRDTLALVGLPERILGNYPSQISGGQRQRVAIARAIIVEPKLIICDEPTSALDVSVQSQILNLLLELRDRLNLTYLVITHDIGVVDYMADDIAVMYLGQIVERGPARQVLQRPAHPYTQMLLESVLTLDTDAGLPGRTGSGASPNPINLPGGCRFHPRCKSALPGCAVDAPLLKTKGNVQARCVLPITEI
ncbi:MAG: dipeptide ABC transporter ATP-binding protein [Burkholderiaceae bacterium]